MEDTNKTIFTCKQIDIKNKEEFERWNLEEKIRINNLKHKKIMRENILRQKRKKENIEKKNQKEIEKQEQILEERKKHQKELYNQFLKKNSQSVIKSEKSNLSEKRKKYSSFKKPPKKDKLKNHNRNPPPLSSPYINDNSLMRDFRNNMTRSIEKISKDLQIENDIKNVYSPIKSNKNSFNEKKNPENHYNEDKYNFMNQEDEERNSFMDKGKHFQAENHYNQKNEDYLLFDEYQENYEEFINYENENLQKNDEIDLNHFEKNKDFGEIYSQEEKIHQQKHKKKDICEKDNAEIKFRYRKNNCYSNILKTKTNKDLIDKEKKLLESIEKLQIRNSLVNPNINKINKNSIREEIDVLDSIKNLDQILKKKIEIEKQNQKNLFKIKSQNNETNLKIKEENKNIYLKNMPIYDNQNFYKNLPIFDNPNFYQNFPINDNPNSYQNLAFQNNPIDYNSYIQNFNNQMGNRNPNNYQEHLNTRNENSEPNKKYEQNLCNFENKPFSNNICENLMKIKRKEINSALPAINKKETFLENNFKISSFNYGKKDNFQNNQFKNNVYFNNNKRDILEEILSEKKPKIQNKENFNYNNQNFPNIYCESEFKEEFQISEKKNKDIKKSLLQNINSKNLYPIKKEEEIKNQINKFKKLPNISNLKPLSLMNETESYSMITDFSNSKINHVSSFGKERGYLKMKFQRENILKIKEMQKIEKKTNNEKIDFFDQDLKNKKEDDCLIKYDPQKFKELFN